MKVDGKSGKERWRREGDRRTRVRMEGRAKERRGWATGEGEEGEDGKWFMYEESKETNESRINLYQFTNFTHKGILLKHSQSAQIIDFW